MFFDLNDSSLLRTQGFVGGRWMGADSGSVTTIHNPATGKQIVFVPNMGAMETRRAIDAAHAAFGPWRAKTGKERSNLLRRWFELIMTHQDDLALILTSEQGKPLPEAKAEIAYGASFIEWFAEEAKRVYGETIPATSTDKRIQVTREPVGVCAAITPWNFPNAMITRKVAPALAAGCTVVLKPAPQTPLSALALAALAERAGVPAGVFNIVTGDAEAIGSEMTSNPLVRKLTFTGSTRTGKLLLRQCADTVKNVSMELGGNAPFIVFDDADLDAAVSGAVASKFRASGQTCVCANRILVQEGIYEAFATRLVARVSALVVGDGLEAGVDQGPLIDENAVKKVEAHVSDAIEKGAAVLCGGKRHPLGRTYFEPTVLSLATPSMLVAREETFGPVAPLFSFKTEAEAIRMANDTEFGLAAYFYARDVGRIYRVSEGLEYGIVGVNTGIVSTEVAPFGGVKESGVGREGSRHGLDAFLEMKYVCQGGIEEERICQSS
jgi:succinate-semialdehyde dehydrogenase/glutarate-semialdehyde dehydrogenase